MKNKSKLEIFINTIGLFILLSGLFLVAKAYYNIDDYDSPKTYFGGVMLSFFAICPLVYSKD